MQGGTIVKRMKRGAILVLIAGVIYMLFEAIASFGWNDPKYSYIFNYISDLGIPVKTEYKGHIINSPLYYFMNSGFILNGLLFAIGIFAVISTLCKRKIPLYILAIIYSVGVCVVGVFPGYDWWGVMYHGFGALGAIGIGNIAVMCLGVSIGKKIGSKFLVILSPILCIIGISGFLIFMTKEDSPIVGLWERISVYTIIFWQIIFGAVLSKRQKRISG
jgi:hypothetical membrane protein